MTLYFNITTCISPSQIGIDDVLDDAYIIDLKALHEGSSKTE